MRTIEELMRLYMWTVDGEVIPLTTHEIEALHDEMKRVEAMAVPYGEHAFERRNA